MNDNFKAFLEGVVEGAKETPRGFFAPVIAFFAWLNRVTDEALDPSAASKDHERAVAGHK